MIEQLQNATDVTAKNRRAVQLLFNGVAVCWVLLFVGLLASFGLMFADMAHTPAAAFAGYLFVTGAVGFIAGMLSIMVLDAPRTWALVKSEFFKS
jgi:FtsH-binding integral membrane protein